MPRGESIAETGKQRSLRVPLDHYRQPNPLVRGRYWLTAVACLAALVYVGWIAMPTASRRQVSPGPLVAAHASWNDDCAACHRDFQPLRSEAVNLVGLVRGNAHEREALDQACIKCHNTPPHHAAAKQENVPTCAACHQDHQGAGADIVRAGDALCLGCHRELQSHRNGPSGLTPPLADITAFRFAAAGAKPPHPAFRSLDQDQGNIKFNHWLHLQPGLAAADSKKKLQVSNLPERYQNQYGRYAQPNGLLQLDCAACHEPDKSGASMRPIAFQQHCQACHSLTWKFSELQPPAEVPHGLAPDRLEAVLDGLVLAAKVRESGAAPAVADESGQAPLIPGKTLGQNLAQKIGQDLYGQRNAAARSIAVKCQECHVVEQPQTASKAEMPAFLPANIPAVWLKHAKFDHRAHRHVECRQCHAAAFAYEQHDKPQFIAASAGGSAARDHQQVMIAGLESCANCHAPRRGATGGARFDCAECHNYHGGDAQLPAAATSTHSSVPGSSLGTHSPEAPASSAPPNTPTIRLTSFRAATSAIPAFTGSSTCASTGCHGATNPKSPSWQTAFTTFASRDPHAQAFDVLWTFRAREMTRLLSQQQQPLSDDSHFRALEQRCLGCHATTSPQSETAVTHYALGVHCESCHGPAGDWLHAHYQTGFPRDTSGFVDTKDFNRRAETCLKCHVGPSVAAGSPQAVDHDLIAAGHPRLSFEFRSYFESLPAHWDRKKDESKAVGSFHFQSWLCGQNEAAAWRNAHQTDPLSDFAQLQCASCHHTIAPSARPPSQRLSGLPAVAPAPMLLKTDKSAAIPERLALARELLSATAAKPRWDDAVQAYLATKAVTADAPINQMADWHSLLAKLSDYLARDSFPAEIRHQRPPSPYDSPRDFDPAIWKQQIEPVIETLRRLESTNN